MEQIELQTTCKSCQTLLHGKFCAVCGEKVVEENDFSFRYMLGQAIDSIFNIDSKLFKSLQLLFFFPGQLSAKYIAGIRVGYIKPFQLFVLSNILFFIFLSDIDIFRTPSQWFFVENFDGVKVLSKVRSIKASTGMSAEEIANSYDGLSSDFAKGLLIVMIPFFAFIGQILHFRKGIAFGKHVIFAIHFFSFFLMLCVIISQALFYLPISPNRWLFIVPITSVMFMYYVMGLRFFYHNVWWSAFAKGVVGVFLINFVIQFYRMGISVLTLYSV